MIQGHWYPKDSSAREEAALLLSSGSFELRIDGHIQLVGIAEQVKVSDRVGNIPRKVELSDGSVFHTSENDAIDHWLKQNKKVKSSKSSGFFHRLETSWPLIMFSLVFVIGFSISLLKWGLPWASEKVAHALPEVIGEEVGKHTFSTLDEVFLSPSELESETKATIKTRFDEELAVLFNDEQGYDVHFRQIRDMPDLANAFALPSGDIVVTDALVKALNNDQLDSVLLHEIGHVYHRHGMRRIVHNSSLTIILTYMFGGDLSIGEELIVGFPIFLMHQHYSREAETEADAFAFEYMKQLGKDPIYFAEALEIITADEHNEHGDHTEEGGMQDYLSTHPATQERIEHAKRLSKEFNSK